MTRTQCSLWDSSPVFFPNSFLNFIVLAADVVAATVAAAAATGIANNNLESKPRNPNKLYLNVAFDLRIKHALTHTHTVTQSLSCANNC